MVNPYDKTTHDGKVVDWLTHAALLEAEIKLGYRLTVVQGSYHGGVSASAGTHDGGGVVDLAPWDWANKVKTLRSLGWAIWHRLPSQGPWNEHVHGVLIGNTKASPSAQRQVTSYRNGRNGLANNAADGSWRPNIIPTYKWPGSDAALLLEVKAKALLDSPKPASVKMAADYSFDRPNPTATKNAGYRGVFRYLGGSAGKQLTDPERIALHKAGLWVSLVFEEGSNRAAGGYAAGVADAKKAEQLADALGYPRNACIFYAVDFDATWAKVADYFRGINATNIRPAGAYGSYQIVEACDVPYRWQTAAWSHGKRSSKANFYQRTDHTRPIVGAKAWDENEILAGVVPVWNPGEAPYVPPVVVPPVVVVPDPPVVVPPTPAVTHTVLQVNLQQTDPVAAIIARATNLIADHSPDVVVWNELGTRDKGVAVKAAIKALPGYYSTFASNVGISWKSERFTHVGDVQVTPVNPGVAGITEQRVIISVDLTDKQTGKTYRQKGGHSVHHVDQGGKARVTGLITGQNARARKYFAVLAAELLADKAKGPVAFCGDLNVDLLAEQKRLPANRTAWFPLTTCATPPVGRVYTIGKATHNDGRLIDWLIVSGRLKGVAQEVLPLNGSDHHPVLSTVALP